MMKVPNGFFDIIVNFIIQKFKSKHTSVKKYTNWDKLTIFLSRFEGTRGEKKPKYSAPETPLVKALWAVAADSGAPC